MRGIRFSSDAQPHSVKDALPASIVHLVYVVVWPIEPVAAFRYGLAAC